MGEERIQQVDAILNNENCVLHAIVVESRSGEWEQNVIQLEDGDVENLLREILKLLMLE